MKRRKRKRSSKGATPAKIPVGAEKPAGSCIGLAGAAPQTHPSDDDFIAPGEVKKPGSDPTAPAGGDYVIDLGDELLAAVQEEKLPSDSSTLAEADQHTHPGNEFTGAQEEKPAGSSVALAGADRRTHPRYKFIAAGELVAAESGAPDRL